MGLPPAIITRTEQDLYEETEIYILVLTDFGPVFGQSGARGRHEWPRLGNAAQINEN